MAEIVDWIKFWVVDNVNQFPVPRPEDEVTDWWNEISEKDRDYLTSPTPSSRCAWCEGITAHTAMCDQQREDWARMRFGKHKKRLITDVPTDYLDFVLKSKYGGESDREQWLEELQKRSDKYKTPRWEGYVPTES